MPNRRESLHDFYRSLPVAGQVTASTGAALTFPFRGAALEHAVVVRADLNGYSSWARSRSAPERAAVLNDFFSRNIPLLEACGGVYFRDEGDCIVALFSPWLGRPVDYGLLRCYVTRLVQGAYGAPQLTAKCVVASGQVAFFQKVHEVPSGDWSAEGEPFVRAARLEQAVSSKRRVTYFKEDYDREFAPYEVLVKPGETPALRWGVENLQVTGLGASGGWFETVYLEALN